MKTTKDKNGDIIIEYKKQNGLLNKKKKLNLSYSIRRSLKIKKLKMTSQ